MVGSRGGGRGGRVQGWVGRVVEVQGWVGVQGGWVGRV